MGILVTYSIYDNYNFRNILKTSISAICCKLINSPYTRNKHGIRKQMEGSA